MYVTLCRDEIDSLLLDEKVPIDSITSLRALVYAHESFVHESFTGNISDIDLHDIVNESLVKVRETFADRLNWYAHPYSAHITCKSRSILAFGRSTLYKELSSAAKHVDCVITPCPLIWFSDSRPLYVIGTDEMKQLSATTINTLISVAPDRSEMDPLELIDLEVAHVSLSKSSQSIIEQRLDFEPKKTLSDRAQEKPEQYVEKTITLNTMTQLLSGIQGPTCAPFQPRQHIQSCHLTYCNEHVLAKVIGGYFPKK